MPSADAEPKPPWSDVPLPVRIEVARILGSPVHRATRAYGGFAPSATFRLSLADGRRAFFKGVGPGSNDFMRRALPQEERVYRALQPWIGSWSPRFLGSLRLADWRAILLEDLGPATVPPWTARAVEQAARGYAAFHERSRGERLPLRLPAREWRSIADQWRRADHEATARLAGRRRDEAREWLDVYGPDLDVAARRLGRAPAPHCLLHLDTRSDNLRLDRAGLRLFDWNWACRGPAEVDVAAFAQSIPADNGPVPEAFVAAYQRHAPLRDAVLDAAVAAVAGLFARSAPRPPVPGLPRLRSIQRRQLKASLGWAARRLNLAEPRWLGAVAD